MMVTGHAAGPDLNRRIERLASRPGRRWTSGRFAVEPAGFSGGLPTIEHRFGVRRAVDERNLAEHEAGNGLGIASVALGDLAANGKTAIDLIFHLGNRNRIDDVG